MSTSALFAGNDSGLTPNRRSTFLEQAPLETGLALSAAIDTFGILEAISLNSFSQPEETLRLLTTVSTPAGEWTTGADHT